MKTALSLTDIRRELQSSATGQLGLDEYQAMARRTHRGSLADLERLNFLLLGLHGEVGSLLSELKKKQRDRGAYVAYARSAIEETGDVLWYFANVAEEAGIPFCQIAIDAGRIPSGTLDATFAMLEPQAALFREPASSPAVQRSLLQLAEQAGRVIEAAQEPQPNPALKSCLASMFDKLVEAAELAHVGLEQAALRNLEKLLGRWPISRDWGPLLDGDDDPDERLPRQLEMVFREREIHGKRFAFQTVNGVNVGDRLTDNSAGEDDYRFHDIFHLAFAAFLGWSPVLRALLKLKRKSVPNTDEEQDGARAIIAEEGISNWVFAQGRRHNDFATVDSLDFSLLKTIDDMVTGYEVQVRPLWMWEVAILEGFRIFRELKRYRGGTVAIDLHARTMTFTPPDYTSP